MGKRNEMRERGRRTRIDRIERGVLVESSIERKEGHAAAYNTEATRRQP